MSDLYEQQLAKLRAFFEQEQASPVAVASSPAGDEPAADASAPFPTAAGSIRRSLAVLRGGRAE